MSTPLLIVGHGTRVAAGAGQFHDLVARVRRLAAGQIAVNGGFMELSEPSVPQALADIAASGARQLVALPLMLLAAGHSKRDIPQELGRHATDRLDIRYGRPLGPHTTLLTLLEQRITAALAGTPAPGTTVILAGQGSTDPEGNADLAKVARLLWEGRGYQAVENAYLSTAVPDLPTVLTKVYTLGSRRIVVAPHLLFHGVLSERIERQAREWASQHPDASVTVAGVIGDCDGLAGLVLERYREAAP